MTPTIVLADDHPILLSGIQNFLEKSGYKIVACAYDGIQAYNQINKYTPHLALLDFDMPKLNGLEVAELCKKNGFETRIIILTLYKEEAIISEIGKSVEGYILKEDALGQIERCIQEVLRAKTWISPNIDNGLHYFQEAEQVQNLTVAEWKILRYLAKNFSSSQIAEELFISKRTVEKHRSNIIQKLEIPPTQNGLLLWVQKHPELFRN